MKLLDLSNKFSPPVVDLRLARIFDDHGSEDCAQLSISHFYPGDVLKEELQYYSDVYPFMETQDLIFYSYPLFREDYNLIDESCFSNWLFCVKCELCDIVALLNDAEISFFKHFIHEIFASGYDPGCEMSDLKKLCGFAGICPGEDYPSNESAN